MAKPKLALGSPAIINRTVGPLRRPNAELRTREYLTAAEVESLIEAAKGNRHGHRDATMILLAFRHGFRAAELVALEWPQMDFAAATLHVRRVKKGTPATHPLRGDELRALRKLQRESAASPFVFTSERGAPFATAGGDWREILKTCVFGTFYGMSEATLAFRIKKDRHEARRIIEAHQEQFPVFWTGLRGAVDYALLFGSLHTRLGWHVHVDRDTNPRSLQNYLMQANGAGMMQVAACLATEQGLSISPIHDAFILTSKTEHIERDTALLRECMAKAGRIVLNGFEVRTSVEQVDYPNRFMDENRGRVMWDRVNKLLAQCQHDDLEQEVAA
jgi:hypothetical protein